MIPTPSRRSDAKPTLGRHDVVPASSSAALKRFPGPTRLSTPSSGALHFAASAEYFGQMVTELWRVLAPGGLFFARLASTIGLDATPATAWACPRDSERFVVDEPVLLEWTTRLGGTLADPIKDDERAADALHEHMVRRTTVTSSSAAQVQSVTSRTNVPAGVV